MKELTPIALPELAPSNPFFASAPTLNVRDEEQPLIRRARVRIFVGGAVFVLFLFLLLSRLADMSMLHSVKSRTFMTANPVKTRLDIVDRNGALLATSLKTWSLYADPRKVWDKVASTEALISVLPDLDPEVIEARLGSKKEFVWIRRNLTPAQRQKVFLLGLPELGFKVEQKRIYPRNRLAAHLLGFTDIDQNGVAGAERAFNRALFAEDGKTGRPVRLSVDMRVQFALTDELRVGLETYRAKAAAGVVLNIKTGEILALASLPDFDPNRPGTVLPENRLNHAAMSVYELGSVFKPITMALALEENVVKDGEKLPVQNKLTIRGKTIHDNHSSPVPLGLFDILAKSSNRGVALLALRAGGEAQQDLLKKLGLLDRVPVELPERAAPLVARNWQDITTVTVSYGHGISVSPLALAVAIGAILNDGVYVQPTILAHETGQALVTHRVVSPQTARTVGDMMRYVVTNGTGRHADVPGYGVMGKTGTAEKIVNGQYDKTRLVTSFVAAFPHRDPHYLVFVTYDEPKPYAQSYGYATAGWNAAYTAGHVVARIAPLLGVKKQQEARLLARAGGAQ